MSCSPDDEAEGRSTRRAVGSTVAHLASAVTATGVEGLTDENSNEDADEPKHCAQWIQKQSEHSKHDETGS